MTPQEKRKKTFRAIKKARHFPARKFAVKN